MFCIECGQQLPENAKFCSQCGVKVSNIPYSEDIVDEVERKAEGIHINDNPIGDIAEFFATSPNVNEIKMSDQLGMNGQTVVHNGPYLTLLKNRAGRYSFYSSTTNTYSEFYEDAKVSNYDGFACVKINGYWGALDRNLKMVVPAIYEYVWSVFEGHAVVKKADKYGVVSTNGEVVIPIQYDFITLNNNGIVMASCNGMFGVMNLSGTILVPFRKYQDRWATCEGLSCVKYNDRYGYISDEGYEIPCIYKKATTAFSGGFAVVTAENGELRIIDRHGNYTDNAKTKPYFGDWDYVGVFNDGVAYINRGGWGNGKYGVIDTNANLIVDFVFDHIDSFDKGHAIVRKDGSEGIINTKGEFVVDLIYDDISNFNEGYACVKREGKYGYIDIDGQIVVDTTFDFAKTFHNGGSPAGKAKLFSVQVGFIDYEGKFIVSWKKRKGYAPIQWLGRSGIVGNMFTEKMGLIDKFGNIVIPILYDSIVEYGDVLVVKKMGRMGILDKFGNEIIPFSAGYDRIFMSDDMWSMCKNGMWTFYDDKFIMITPHNYETQADCNCFKYGFAQVCINGRWVLLDKNGVEFESVKGYDAGVFAESRKPTVKFR